MRITAQKAQEQAQKTIQDFHTQIEQCCEKALDEIHQEIDLTSKNIDRCEDRTVTIKWETYRIKDVLRDLQCNDLSYYNNKNECILTMEGNYIHRSLVNDGYEVTIIPGSLTIVW